MPIKDSGGGAGSGGSAGSGSGGGGSTSAAVEAIEEILTTASGSVTTATQILSSPNYTRNVVLIVNTDSTDDLYVGFASDVTATKHVAKLAPGTSLKIRVFPSISLYLFASSSCSYTVYEMKLGYISTYTTLP